MECGKCLYTGCIEERIMRCYDELRENICFFSFLLGSNLACNEE